MHDTTLYMVTESVQNPTQLAVQDLMPGHETVVWSYLYAGEAVAVWWGGVPVDGGRAVEVTYHVCCD